MGINVEELYTRYGPMVLRRCRFLLNDEDQALDAMQDVFVNLLSHSEKIENIYPSGLLYRIATNICLNMLRNKKRRRETADNDILGYIADYNDPAETVAASDLLDLIFRNEKSSTREIATMLYVDGMTLDQAAGHSGLSVSGVRKRMRILKEKVSCLKEEIYEN
jgi:RNA polymerase sigma-70 factor, ECF subfamily